MRHRRIQDKLSNTDITIETLGEPYIINGKLNDILSLISTIPIEIMGDNIFWFSDNKYEYILFEETGLCVKKLKGILGYIIRKYDKKKQQVYLLLTNTNNKPVEIVINKRGKIRVDINKLNKPRKFNIIPVVLGIISVLLGWLVSR